MAVKYFSSLSTPITSPKPLPAVQSHVRHGGATTTPRMHHNDAESMSPILADLGRPHKPGARSVVAWLLALATGGCALVLIVWLVVALARVLSGQP